MTKDSSEICGMKFDFPPAILIVRKKVPISNYALSFTPHRRASSDWIIKIFVYSFVVGNCDGAKNKTVYDELPQCH